MKIVLNTFPRRVRVAGETYDPARVVAWEDGTIRVYSTPSGVPAVVLEGKGTWQHVGGRVEVSLEGGIDFTCERRGGCGCGHVLKRWPYEGLSE